MPYRKRPRIDPTEDWSQLRLRLAWPEQVGYELIRPVVLFGLSPGERAKQTGIAELKTEYAAFRPHELARICYARFGRRPSPHTVKRILADEPAPLQIARRS